jgi:diacylglycerol kinase family enzyme
MQVVVIANPVATAVVADPGLPDRVARAIEGVPATVTVVRTRSATDAAEAGRAHGDADVVVVVGGDGTLNGAVAGLLSAPGHRAAVAPFPAGSTNVVARSLGFDRRPDRALGQLVEALRAGRRTAGTVGHLDERLFLANAGIGLDAAVVARAEVRPGRKHRFGGLWFLWCLGTELLVGPLGRAGPRLDVVDGTGRRHRGRWVVALARSPYVWLGALGVDLLPRADRTQGTVLLLRSLGPTTVVDGLRAVAASTGVLGARLGRLDSTGPVVVTAERPVQVDGEVVTPRATATISFTPGGVTFVTS